MTAPTTLSPPVGAARPVRLRPDIQGLRAVAVLLVVLDHLLGWPSGGFVGVDVFFVISGYLITGLLLREHAAAGWVDLATFYRRRARRILPAAGACLAIVVAASWLLYSTSRAGAIAVDAAVSAVFAANWHVAAAGTDYLAAGGPVSPLQHFWSLAVEEQFYLFWPLAVILLLAAARFSARRHPSALLAGACIVGIVGSFLWAVAETATSPTWAYFSTLSRAFELGAGALLAILAGRVRLPAVARTALFAVGIAVIGAAAVLIDLTTSFPGPWAVLPVAGALLVLGVGIGGQPRHAWLLTNAGAQYVGRISYSLYLWHFPVIVLVGSALGAAWFSVPLTALLIVASSIASFHLVEERFRHGRTGRTPMTAGGRRRRWMPAIAAVAVGTVAVVGFSASGTATAPAAGLSGAAPADPGSDPQAQLTAEIQEALRTDDWPLLVPQIDGLAETGRPPRDAECAIGLADPDEPTVIIPRDGTLPARLEGAAAGCTFGAIDAPRLAVVAGDSIAISWIPLVQALLEPQGYRVQGLTMSGCPLVDTRTRNAAANIAAFCPDHKERVAAAIMALQPDVLVLSNTYQPWLAGEPDLTTAAARYALGQRSVIDRVASSTGSVVVLAPPPPGRAPADCATTVSSPADCVSAIPDDWRQFNEAMARHLDDAGATYTDTSGWFCDAAGACPAFVGATPTRRDAAGHVVPAYARRLAPLLEMALSGR